MDEHDFVQDCDCRDERIKELEALLAKAHDMAGAYSMAKRSGDYWKAEHLAGNDRIAELTAALKEAKDALDHYQHGGSSYRKPAEAALSKIEELGL